MGINLGWLIHPVCSFCLWFVQIYLLLLGFTVALAVLLFDTFIAFILCTIALFGSVFSSSFLSSLHSLLVWCYFHL